MSAEFTKNSNYETKHTARITAGIQISLCTKSFLRLRTLNDSQRASHITLICETTEFPTSFRISRDTRRHTRTRKQGAILAHLEVQKGSKKGRRNNATPPIIATRDQGTDLEARGKVSTTPPFPERKRNAGRLC